MTTLSSMLSSGINAVRIAMLVAVVVSAARYDSAWNSADDSPPYSASLGQWRRITWRLRQAGTAVNRPMIASARISR